QNQSIDDSDADLARDLRILVRERLANGDTDQQVLNFLTARYGDFVLLKPPVKPATWALWFGPLLVLGIAILGIVIRLRRKARVDAPALSPEEQAALKRLMDKGPS
ncbi:MAG: cytochrome c-type biogenesis protein CcmH, partial [Rhodospirillales bacterium]|nr:cytochrome c-type biogenesis protein CcmH [Rhodospirillales bacterium]